MLMNHINIQDSNSDYMYVCVIKDRDMEYRKVQIMFLVKLYVNIIVEVCIYGVCTIIFRHVCT